MTEMKEQIWADWIKERDDPKTAGAKPEALDDITILDLSFNSFAGNACSSMLAEFGAKVLRIEPPEGDFIRTCTPYGILHKGVGIDTFGESAPAGDVYRHFGITAENVARAVESLL